MFKKLELTKEQQSELDRLRKAYLNDAKVPGRSSCPVPTEEELLRQLHTSSALFGVKTAVADDIPDAGSAASKVSSVVRGGCYR